MKNVDDCKWYLVKSEDEYGVQYNGDDPDNNFPRDLDGMYYDYVINDVNVYVDEQLMNIVLRLREAASEEAVERRLHSDGRGYSNTASSPRASTPAPTPCLYVISGAKNLQSQFITELVRFNRDQLQNPHAKHFKAVCEKVTRLCDVEPIRFSRVAVSGVVTFSIIGKPENVAKARNRLQNEVGIKV